MKKINVDLKVIGVIHSPYKTRADAPRQGTNDICEIHIDKEFEQGLKDIEGFSHVHVFYWFHESKNYNLLVRTPWDVEPHGVFCTRSPNHPNPIAYSAVELVERKKNILRVRGLDAIDSTSVIDIKPYIKKIDMKDKSVCGWCEKTDIKV